MRLCTRRKIELAVHPLHLICTPISHSPVNQLMTEIIAVGEFDLLAPERAVLGGRRRIILRVIFYFSNRGSMCLAWTILNGQGAKIYREGRRR
jgi:hypothetical protein